MSADEVKSEEAVKKVEEEEKKPLPPPLPKLRVENWQKDVVYLFQFPRTKVIPSISPFCLKLETWLRMADIKFENHVSMTARSKKGQLPFVELNGKEIADSALAIKELGQHYNVDLDSHLSDMEKANGLAYDTLINDGLFWSWLMERTEHMKEVFGEKCQGKGFPSWPMHFRLLKNGIAWRIGSVVKSRCVQHGIGRHTVEEAIEIGRGQLNALSTILGTKKFFNGDKPTTLDATAFGHLGQTLFLPLDLKLKEHMEKECPNLVEYLKRVKEQFYPDWEEATEQVAANTKWMKDRLTPPTD